MFPRVSYKTLAEEVTHDTVRAGHYREEEIILSAKAEEEKLQSAA